MSTITKATIKARARLARLYEDLEEDFKDERGDVVQTAMVVGLGVTLGLLLIAAVTGAFDGYVAKIK